MERHKTIIIMFCVERKVWWDVLLNHRNAEEVRIHCHADELMCMIWSAMSHTFEYRRNKQVHRCTHHVLQWDQQPTPAKDAIKKPLTSCPAHGIMRMMWCIGSQSCVSQLTSCFMIQPGYTETMVSNPSAVHHVVQMRSCINACRMRSRTKDWTTRRQILLCYSFFFHLACCILLSVAW